MEVASKLGNEGLVGVRKVKKWGYEENFQVQGYLWIRPTGLKII
jgi:hypothetical protein